jgi:hypothetical protein
MTITHNKLDKSTSGQKASMMEQHTFCLKELSSRAEPSAFATSDILCSCIDDSFGVFVGLFIYSSGCER